MPSASGCPTTANDQSQSMFEADIIVEMFVFAEPRRDGSRRRLKDSAKERRPPRCRIRNGPVPNEEPWLATR